MSNKNDEATIFDRNRIENFKLEHEVVNSVQKQLKRDAVPFSLCIGLSITTWCFASSTLYADFVGLFTTILALIFLQRMHSFGCSIVVAAIVPPVLCLVFEDWLQDVGIRGGPLSYVVWGPTLYLTWLYLCGFRLLVTPSKHSVFNKLDQFGGPEQIKLEVENHGFRLGANVIVTREWILDLRTMSFFGVSDIVWAYGYPKGAPNTMVLRFADEASLELLESEQNISETLTVLSRTVPDMVVGYSEEIARLFKEALARKWLDKPIEPFDKFKASAKSLDL